MKPKVFQWEGIAITLVERGEPRWEGSTETWKPVRAIGPNGGVIPVNFTGSTQKGFIAQTIALLDSFARRRSKEEVIHALTQEL